MARRTSSLRSSSTRLTSCWHSPIGVQVYGEDASRAPCPAPTLAHRARTCQAGDVQGRLQQGRLPDRASGCSRRRAGSSTCARRPPVSSSSTWRPAPATSPTCAAPVAPRVVAVDLEVAQLRLGRERDHGVGWVVGDAVALPLRDGSADQVLSTFGLIFAPDPARAVEQAARVCRPGGVLGLATWSGHHLQRAQYDVMSASCRPARWPRPPRDLGQRGGGRRAAGPRRRRGDRRARGAHPHVRVDRRLVGGPLPHRAARRDGAAAPGRPGVRAPVASS
jgi:hypothetical protein